MSKCAVEGCNAPVCSRGYCSKHYRSVLRHGSVNGRKWVQGTLKERFLFKVNKFSGVDGCWEWDGALTGKGYGAIQEGSTGSRVLLAHRVSYEIFNGQLVRGMCVMHKCDNTTCVNPAHLVLGTSSDNAKDAIAKGRKFIPNPGKGEANPRSKLTLEQAKFIKANPQMMHTELANMFGLSPNCIRSVRIGRTWRDA